MNDARDRLSDRRSTGNPRLSQFSLRTVLLFVTACCVLFAGLAASPERTVGFLAILGLLAAAAGPASQMPRGLAWLIGGAAAGFVAGLLLGIALVRQAYGPADTACAWNGFWILCYFSPLGGGVLGTSLAGAGRPVAILVLLGSAAPLIGALVVGLKKCMLILSARWSSELVR